MVCRGDSRVVMVECNDSGLPDLILLSREREWESAQRYSIVSQGPENIASVAGIAERVSTLPPRKTFKGLSTSLVLRKQSIFSFYPHGETEYDVIRLFACV